MSTEHVLWDFDSPWRRPPRQRRARTAVSRRARPSKRASEEQLHWFPWCRTPAESYPKPRTPRAPRKPKHTAPPRALTQAENTLVSQAYKAIKRACGLYSNLTMRAGLEPEDASQEILTIFCARLQGQHPYDPRRASLTNYCTMLTRSVLINRLNKRRRHSIGYDRLADAMSGRTGGVDLDAMSELVTPEDEPRHRGARFRRLAQMASTMPVAPPAGVSTKYILQLPTRPPPKNRSHRVVRGRPILSAESRRWRAELQKAATTNGWPKIHTGRWAIRVITSVDRQRHLDVDVPLLDSDAVLAGVRDGLQAAGIVDDDMRIIRSTSEVVYRQKSQQPVCVVVLEELEDDLAEELEEVLRR